MRCASCGYDRSTHDAVTLKCAIETADRNGRRGSFKVPPAPDCTLWRDIITRDVRARFQAIEDARKPYVPEVVPPPQVPARAPHGPGELAGYGGRQAVGLGRSAVAAGWSASAHYWRAADGTEGCAVRLARDDLRAVATWTRAAGKIGAASGWKADVGYGWRVGTLPAKLNHTDLERVISE